MPILPTNFSRLVGIDISNEIIDYARKTQIYPKLSFEQFDLCTDLEKQPLSNTEPYDHIFSFFTLMWISTCFRTCIQTFYKLFVPNGDMLLLLSVGKHPLYDIYKEQSLNEKWAKYMEDVDKVILPFQYAKDSEKEFFDFLDENGFTDCDVRFRRKNFTYESIDATRGMFHYNFIFFLHFLIRNF